jgi:purine nucleosidase
MKVLLDTDIGTDIDDAIALAFLLSHPECELMGVTTVSGKPVDRASIASALCKAAGKDVPIFPGIERPLSGIQKQPEAAQASALAGWPHKKNFLQGEAIPFMRRIIRENPGEVVLLPIGPLTNVATLFAMDEEIPHLLKGLVLMGGTFRPHNHCPQVEWNIMCDPVAAAIVYRSPVKFHRSIGLDVTMQVTMPKAEVRRRFTGRILKPVLDFAEVWFNRCDTITFHDPLAAATLFDESLCTYERGLATVEVTSERLAGFTFWNPRSDGPHEIAVGVDPARFLDLYFSITGGGK